MASTKSVVDELLDLIPPVEEIKNRIRKRTTRKKIRATLIAEILDSINTRLTVDVDPLNEDSPVEADERTYVFRIDIKYVSKRIGAQLAELYCTNEIDGEIWEQIVTPVANAFAKKEYQVSSPYKFCYDISVTA